jgi:hypothetical protein
MPLAGLTAGARPLTLRCEGMGVPRSKLRPARRNLPRARSWGAPRGGREQSSEVHGLARSLAAFGRRVFCQSMSRGTVADRAAVSARLAALIRPRVLHKPGRNSAPHGIASTASAMAHRGSVAAGRSNAEHRRHNGRPRTIGQLRCSIARKGVRYLRRCTAAGDDSAARRP